MALADIQKKSAEERKREKRLVHLTNALSRDYLDSAVVKKATKIQKENAEYLIKSILDYLFFEEKKELRELNEKHIQHFMLAYVPQKLHLSAETGKATPDILADFLSFLNETGHINNGEQLRNQIKADKRAFLKLIPKPSKTTKPKQRVTQKSRKKTAVKEPKIEVKVGRNDPCPCGSGKKYKKCCGQSR